MASLAVDKGEGRYGYGVDDFWGVIWGASIALVASIVGGALTALAGPALARKAEAKERLRVSEAERREVVRQAIQDASLAMRRASIAWIADQDAATVALTEEIDVISISLRLRTTQDEAVVERSLGFASIQDTHEAFIAHSVAWERVAALWFRGTVTNEDFEDALTEEREHLERRLGQIIANRSASASVQSDDTEALP